MDYKIFLIASIAIVFLLPNISNVYAQDVICDALECATIPEPCVDEFNEGFEQVRIFAELLPDGTQQNCVRVLDLICDNEQISWTIHLQNCLLKI